MRKRLNRRGRPGGCAIITLLCAVITFWSFFYPFSDIHLADKAPTGNFAGYEVASDLQINSSNAVLISLNDEKALFDKDSSARIYPASMTKIMTAIVLLENLSDLNETIVLNEEMYSGIYEANAMTAGFQPNEEVSAIDLLYGLLLPSGAECAIGLAEHVAGSESDFVDLMNDKARELGMNGTHFTNATGLHDTEHYSTVWDISVLLQYALKNKTFYEIFTANRYSSQPTNPHQNSVTCYSTLFSKMDSADFDSGSILGGKTGYTNEAGQCLASLAEKDGERFILVTCGAPGDNKTQKLHIDDAFTVYTAIAAVD